MTENNSKNAGPRKQDRWEKIFQWVLGAIIAASLAILFAPSILRKSDRLSAWLDEKKVEEAMLFGRIVAEKEAANLAKIKAEEEAMQKAWEDREHGARDAGWSAQVPTREVEAKDRKIKALQDGKTKALIGLVTGEHQEPTWSELAQQMADAEKPGNIVFEGEWHGCVALIHQFFDTVLMENGISPEIRRHSILISCGTGYGVEGGVGVVYFDQENDALWEYGTGYGALVYMRIAPPPGVCEVPGIYELTGVRPSQDLPGCERSSPVDSSEE